MIIRNILKGTLFVAVAHPLTVAVIIPYYKGVYYAYRDKKLESEKR